jgi:hypothetical protein
VADNGIPAAIGAGFLGKAGPVLAAVAGLATWKSGQAAEKKQCPRVRISPPLPGVLIGMYSDGSKHCRN